MDVEDLSFLEEWNDDFLETESNNNKVSDSVSPDTSRQDSKGKGKGKKSRTELPIVKNSKASEAARPFSSRFSRSRSNSPNSFESSKTNHDLLTTTPPMLRGAGVKDKDVVDGEDELSFVEEWDDDFLGTEADSKSNEKGKNSTFNSEESSKFSDAVRPSGSGSRSRSSKSRSNSSGSSCANDDGQSSKQCPNEPSNKPINDLMSKNLTMFEKDKNVVDVDDDYEVIDLTLAADLADIETLAGNLMAMFPDTPQEYIRQKCHDLVGNPVAIERFTDQLLADPTPPDSWRHKSKKVCRRVENKSDTPGPSTSKGISDPKPDNSEANHIWILEKHSKLIAMFPDLCPYYLLTVVQGIKVDSQSSGGDIDLLFAGKVGDMLAMSDVEKRKLPSSSAVSKVKLKPSDLRTINFSDPSENMYRFAEGHFYKTQRPGSIESMDIVSNPKLKAAFEDKQRDFERRQIPHLPIFAYHGTNAANIDSILQTNFDITKAKRQAHGPGNYFSEYPATALNYSNDQKTLIFCQILPGRQYKGPQPSWPDYDSKLVSPDSNDVSQMVIIQNKDQILPCAVIHLSASPATQVITSGFASSHPAQVIIHHHHSMPQGTRVQISASNLRKQLHGIIPPSVQVQQVPVPTVQWHQPQGATQPLSMQQVSVPTIQWHHPQGVQQSAPAVQQVPGGSSGSTVHPALGAAPAVPGGSRHSVKQLKFKKPKK